MKKNLRKQYFRVQKCYEASWLTKYSLRRNQELRRTDCDPKTKVGSIISQLEPELLATVLRKGAGSL